MKKATIFIIIFLVLLIGLYTMSGFGNVETKENEVGLDIEYTNNSRESVQGFTLDYKVDTKEVKTFKFSVKEEKQFNFKYTSSSVESGILVSIKNSNKKHVSKFSILDTEGSNVINLYPDNYILEVSLPENTEGKIHIDWKE